MRAHLLAALLVLPACFDDSGPIEIRACNDSELDFDAVEYSDFGDSGPLPAGACTEYERATHVLFAYTNAKVTIGADSFQVLPIDFVGETPLPGGRWSYRLTFSDAANRELDIQAARD